MYKVKRPVDWKCCGTCLNWCGKQTPDVFCMNVEFYEDEKARCADGPIRGSSMEGRNYCSGWEPRFKK